MKRLNNLNTFFKFSFRILFREWKRFLLPFFSLVFTTLIVLTVLLFTNSSSSFLTDKNKELIGGDVSIEANYEINKENINSILDSINQKYQDTTVYDFSGILIKDDLNQPASINVVEENFPLYGYLILEEGEYVYPKENEIYIDKNTKDKLNINIGEELIYANKNFKVAGIITENSQSLLAGFRILPEVFISKQGFESLNIDKNLLRAEYTNLYLFENELSKNQKNYIFENLKNTGARIEVLGITSSGFIEGLSLVEQFLILAVLLSAILSAVNIYAGMLYFVYIMRRSFSILIALGFSKRKIIFTLCLSLFYVLFIAFVVGVLISLFIFDNLASYINSNFGLELKQVKLITSLILTTLILFSISFASFIPTLRNILKINPKNLLSHSYEDKRENQSFANFLFITISTLIPLILIAIFLLDSFLYGFLSILVIAITYIVLAVIFYFILKKLYEKREKFNFLVKTLIAQKKNDGLFGIVSLTSLYIALSSLSLLILLQATLINFIQNDLASNIPSLYVVDIQKSQTQDLKNNYPELTFFPNIPGRILEIDNLDIQNEIKEENLSREFGREYNLTYRKDLLTNEKIDKGVWLSGIPNEVSVEKDFANRAKIKLNSKIVLSIQGFPNEFTVTSIRESDSRSGLPFFYFVFNPSDLEKYPATFFGFTYLEGENKNNFVKYLASNFPNISTIDTGEVGIFVSRLVETLLILIFIISLPPVILALFLIITLIVSSFDSRRKQSAQLLAIGGRRSFIEKLYYLETISTTLFSSALGYLTALIGIFFISKYFFKIDSFAVYDIELLIALGVIIFFVIILAFIIWKREKKPLRKLLTYEEF